MNTKKLIKSSFSKTKRATLIELKSIGIKGNRATVTNLDYLISVPVSHLTDKRLSDGCYLIQSNIEDTLSGGFSAKLNMPRLISEEAEKELRLLGEVNKEFFEKVVNLLPFSSHRESRWIINSIFVAPEGRLVATNSFTLGMYEINHGLDLGFAQVILPNRYDFIYKWIAKEAQGPIQLYLNEYKLRIVIGEVIIDLILIEGNYPNYKQVIPKLDDVSYEIPSDLFELFKTNKSIINHKSAIRRENDYNMGKSILILSDGSWCLLEGNPDTVISGKIKVRVATDWFKMILDYSDGSLKYEGNDFGPVTFRNKDFYGIVMMVRW